MDNTAMYMVGHDFTNPLVEYFFALSLPMIEARAPWVVVVIHMLLASWVVKGPRLTGCYLFFAVFFMAGIVAYTQSVTQIAHTTIAHAEVSVFILLMFVYIFIAALHLHSIHVTNLSVSKAYARLAGYRASIGGIFEEAFKHAPTPVLILDYDGYIVSASDEMSSELGYAPWFLEEKHINILLPAKFREGHMAKVQAFLDLPDGKASRSVSVLRKSGKESTMKLSISSIKISGKVYGMGALS